MKKGALLAVLTFLILIVVVQPAFANVSGAIFTSLVDGARVNANIYQAKEDVYLDGGPGPQAPSQAAALDPGWYYFQVTDPSGKVLLSEDPVECRQFRVGADGFIVEIKTGCTHLVRYRGDMVLMPCDHLTGIDLDYGDDGAITVQLMPYKDTPNPGGVYKVWVTPVDKFVGDPALVDNPGYFHGFVPAWSKTDNFKVKGRKITPTITVRKFHDLNANGVWDFGEPELTWVVDYVEPSTAEGTDVTPFTLLAADPGDYWFIERPPVVTPSWKQTALIIDGVPQPVSATALVTVVGTSGETHEVIFGNVQTVCVKAEKYYDANANGAKDAGELPVAGIKFVLTGTDVTGAAIGPDVKFSGADGIAAWCGLLPGTYTVQEVLPPNWYASTPTTRTTTLGPGGMATFEFGNYCVGTADFNTKGYWHNKNGLAELTEADRLYVNGLLPYSSASSYFGAGDEPFDGMFTGGAPVEAAFADDGSMIWGAGTWQSEVSHFLVDSNAGGDPREQLAQQLLAFIFNVRHRLGGDATMKMPDGSWMPASSVISGAIGAWSAGGADANSWAGLLDGFNNSDAVEFICPAPCHPVVY